MKKKKQTKTIPTSQIEYNKPRVFPGKKNLQIIKKKMCENDDGTEERDKRVKKAHTTFISTCRQKTKN
jgi:hypothetical protein